MHSVCRFGLFLLTCGLAACTGVATTPGTPSSLPGNSSASLESIDTVTWTLRTFTDAQGGSVALPAGATFSITLRDNRLDVQSDCNRCNGPATLQGSSLDLGLLACTRAFCPSSPVDSQFQTALQGRHTVLVDDSRLTLSSSRAVLVFTR